jgi:hypothetical protein
MRHRRALARSGLILGIFLLIPCFGRAQSNSSASGTATFTVTASGKKETAPPPISKDDVQLFQGKERRQIASWEKGNELFLAILIDDEISTDFGTVMGEVKDFITSQSPATHIAVGYIRDNTTMLAQDFTDDHESAAKAIRLPLGTGAIGSSPYLGTMDLLKRWPQTGPRRSIVLISSGIDFFRGRQSQVFNPDLDGVIERAERQNTNIWSVYYPSSGHRFGGSYLLLSYAQDNMGKLAEDTGGESYYLFYQQPVTLKPYLNDISMHLNNQYLLTFGANSGPKGKFVSVKVKTELHDVDLMTHASAVWVAPSGGQ